MKILIITYNFRKFLITKLTHMIFNIKLYNILNIKEIYKFKARVERLHREINQDGGIPPYVSQCIKG